MIHAREDYQRFQDPALTDTSLLGAGSTPVAEDEPVMLFRAKDTFFVPVLRLYRSMIDDSGLPANKKQQMLNAIDAHTQLAKKWQAQNGKHLPDMPEGEGKSL